MRRFCFARATRGARNPEHAMSAPLVPTLGGVSPLPSGWNTTAAELYERVTDALLSEDPSFVLTVQLAPVGPVRVSGKHELYGARGF